MEAVDEAGHALGVDADAFQVARDVVSAQPVHAADAAVGHLRLAPDRGEDIEQVIGQVGEAPVAVGGDTVGDHRALLTRVRHQRALPAR